MKTDRQYLITIRIDADNSEEVEHFFHHWKDENRLTLDMEEISGVNHEVIDWEEIDPERED